MTEQKPERKPVWIPPLHRRIYELEAQVKERDQIIIELVRTIERMTGTKGRA